MRRALAIAGIGVFLVLAIRRFVPVIPLALTHHEPGPVPDPAAEPRQVNVAGSVPIALSARQVELVPRAHYEIAAEVVSTARYRLDAMADVIPWDVALIWGDLAKEPFRSSMSCYQDARFYLWSTADLSIGRDYIVAHSANVHVIPATPTIRAVLAHVRRRDHVALSGDLVDVEGTEGRSTHWTTSLSRNDVDAGSCETIYLRSINVNGRVYR
ncbi:MAG: hypothetical protein U0166_07500 [Acidobacteriota bacterium]